MTNTAKIIKNTIPSLQLGENGIADEKIAAVSD